MTRPILAVGCPGGRDLQRGEKNRIVKTWHLSCSQYEFPVVQWLAMHFEILDTIRDIELIATGRRIRALARIRKRYGSGRWQKLKGVARVRLANGNTRLAEVHWYEAHGIGMKGLKIKRLLDEWAVTRKKRSPQFLLCIRNGGCDDLELRKLYQVLPDTSAEKDGYVRVIDESGEDYLYPTGYFLAIPLPESIAEEFAAPA